MTTEGSFPLKWERWRRPWITKVNPPCNASCYWRRCLWFTVFTRGRIPTLLSGILVMTSVTRLFSLSCSNNLGDFWAIKIQDFLPLPGVQGDSDMTFRRACDPLVWSSWIHAWGTSLYCDRGVIQIWLRALGSTHRPMELRAWSFQ